ncbi:Bicoid-interacting protein 3-domain-containing protein [Amylostereum chailletii]|nr:Bicoid-interacting protein 3-domain-containing protein [Amylostereum chailletii]
MSSSDNFIPIYGNYRNYHGYYYRHPGPSDPRLSLLPQGLLVNARILDVGCNEGWVSCQTWGAQRVVGVDIDDVLVRAAWKRRRIMWSHQEPELSDTSPAPPPRKRKKLDTDATMANTLTLRPDYFPASFQHMFGTLPIRSSDTSFDGKHCANADSFLITSHFVAQIGFSVSKWIHLNGGDAGLRRFFRRVYETLTPGGTFVFEPQQWDSYTKARKLHPSLQEAARSLQIHTDDFESILTDMGFKKPQRLGVPGEGRACAFSVFPTSNITRMSVSGFRRPVELYVKPGTR